MEFLSEEHKKSFITFLEEAYLEVDIVLASALRERDSFLKRQLAFLYMIAYYQEAYRHYEGEVFYIEGFEELEIGGPTYLLEEKVELRDEYPHEKALQFAKAILMNKPIALTKGRLVKEEDILEKLYHHALEIANN